MPESFDEVPSRSRSGAQELARRRADRWIAVGGAARVEVQHRVAATEIGLTFGENWQDIHADQRIVSAAATEKLADAVVELDTDHGVWLFSTTDWTADQIRYLRSYREAISEIIATQIAAAISARRARGRVGKSTRAGLRLAELRDSSPASALQGGPQPGSFTARRPLPGPGEARAAELYVANCLQGTVTRASGDAGIDVLAQGYAIQVKNTASLVQRPVIQSIAGAARGKGRPAVWANVGFTPGAIEEARRLDVTLFRF